jgi:hypothetical protein
MWCFLALAIITFSLFKKSTVSALAQHLAGYGIRKLTYYFETEKRNIPVSLFI